MAAVVWLFPGAPDRGNEEGEAGLLPRPSESRTQLVTRRLDPGFVLRTVPLSRHRTEKILEQSLLDLGAEKHFGLQL